MKKYSKKICIFIILFCLFFYYHTDKAYGKEELFLYSLSCVLIDGDTGRILYNKNGEDIRPMASTTKIMTLIVTLESDNIDNIAIVSKKAANMPKVRLGMMENDRFYVNDLLYSLMLESHNDSAVVIAESVAGSVENFASLMNDKAKELNLCNTYFITPNGLDAKVDDKIHSTSAYDMAQLMKYCCFDSPKKEEFIKICNTKNYSFSDVDGKKSYYINNKNAYMNMRDGVIAGKTGFTNDAGYCYVCALELNNKKYVLALLGCGWPNNKNYKWKDSDTLFNYGINEYTNYKIDYSSMCRKIEVKNGVDCKDLLLVPSMNFNMPEHLLVSKEDKVTISYDLPDYIYAPIDRNEIIGSANLLINNEVIYTYNMVSDIMVQKYDYNYCIKQIYNFIFTSFL